MGDLHQVIVDDIGQVVGRQLVGTLEKHLVVKDIALHMHLATYHIVDNDILSGVDSEAHHILVSLSQQAFYLAGRQGQ